MLTSRSTDALGKAIKAYYEGNTAAQLTTYSSIDGMDKMPVAQFFRTFLTMPQIEQLALMLCQGKILDVGAGSGCHSLILQEKDFDVTSLDVSIGATEVMKAQGLQQVVCHSIFDFKSTQKFDTLLFMMNGIGVGGDLKGVERLLKYCKNLLAHKGQIIFDSSDIYKAFINDNGAVCLDLSLGYYGTVSYQLEFEETKSEQFLWTYIDAATLNEIAHKMGYELEIILQSNEEDYLGRLTLIAEQG